MLLYAVFGFGSIALVALGELPALDARSDLFRFYIKLIFGGFLIFYTVLIHFALLPPGKETRQNRASLRKVDIWRILLVSHRGRAHVECVDLLDHCIFRTIARHRFLTFVNLFSEFPPVLSPNERTNTT